MAYKPKKLGGTSIRGLAKVELNKTGTAIQVWFHPEVDGTHAGKKFKPEKWPEWISPTINDVKEWMVNLSGDKKTLYAMHPYKAFGVKGRVVGIASQQDKPPTPTKKVSQYGEYWQFTVLIEITEGPSKGAVVPYFLRYNFGSDDDNNIAYTHWGQNSVHTPRLDDFLKLTGVWDYGPIPYSDNILPVLQKRMLQAGKELVFQIKDGWLVSESLDVLDDDNAQTWDESSTPAPTFDDDDNTFAPQVEEDSWDDEDSDESKSETEFSWDD